MPGFVIEYHRRTGEKKVTEFGQQDGYKRAVKARLAQERTNHDPDVEIVALMGSSLDALKQTHSRYFMADRTAQNV
ncbi:hypothetical protein [Rothia halotolerans]|uniref:hypothetical protein n=1 Tax=Rothia halotolerans TaxID=405770 RepID=UPI00101D11A1|nr:hypothetical protein [Rothia halotolerans]